MISVQNGITLKYCMKTSSIRPNIGCRVSQGFMNKNSLKGRKQLGGKHMVCTCYWVQFQEREQKRDDKKLN